jgi:uncharacterized membrane protein
MKALTTVVVKHEQEIQKFYGGELESPFVGLVVTIFIGNLPFILLLIHFVNRIYRTNLYLVNIFFLFPAEK